MSEEIRNLALQLRAWSEPIASGYEVPAAARTLHAAADALEAMAGEVERLRGVCKYDALNAGAIAEIRRACKEIMGDNVSFVDDDFARGLLTIKAERDRLKAALDVAKDHAKQNQRVRDSVSPYPNDHAKRIVWEKTLYHEGKDLLDKLCKALGGDAS